MRKSYTAVIEKISKEGTYSTQQGKATLKSVKTFELNLGEVAFKCEKLRSDVLWCEFMGRFIDVIKDVGDTMPYNSQEFLDLFQSSFYNISEDDDLKNEVQKALLKAMHVVGLIGASKLHNMGYDYRMLVLTTKEVMPVQTMFQRGYDLNKYRKPLIDTLEEFEYMWFRFRSSGLDRLDTICEFLMAQPIEDIEKLNEILKGRFEDDILDFDLIDLYEGDKRIPELEAMIDKLKEYCK